MSSSCRRSTLTSAVAFQPALMGEPRNKVAPAPADARDWERLKTKMAEYLGEFAELAKSSPQELQREIESAHDGDKKLAGTLAAVLWQMVAHNSYHLGQIALLRRALGAWPPRAGGDSW